MSFYRFFFLVFFLLWRTDVRSTGRAKTLKRSHSALEQKDINVITATQIIVLLLFAFGILFALLMYCKTCNRSIRARYLAQSRCGNEDDRETATADSLYRYGINESRERPPSYSEACSAPPLYGSPFNRASMLEAPPVYPDTPKLSDRVHDQGFPVTYHI